MDITADSLIISVSAVVFGAILVFALNGFTKRLDDINKRLDSTNNKIDRVSDDVKENGTAIQNLSNRVTALETKVDMIIPHIPLAPIKVRDQGVAQPDKDPNTTPSQQKAEPASA